MKFVSVMWPRCRAWRGLLVAVVVFAALQAARSRYYFQHVATAIFEEVDPAGFEKSGLVVGGFGRARLSTRLTSEILQYATPEAIETLRSESTVWDFLEAGSADAVLLRECHMRVGKNKENGRRTITLTIGASDPAQAEYWGRQTLVRIMMFHAHRIFEQMEEQARVLSAEIDRLGDQATDEMRQRVRALRPMKMRTATMIRLRPAGLDAYPEGTPPVSEAKRFVLWRFLRLAAFNGSIAAVAGLIVFAILARRGSAAS